MDMISFIDPLREGLPEGRAVVSVRSVYQMDMISFIDPLREGLPEGRAAKQVQYNMLRHARGPTASSKFALLHRPTKNNVDNERDM